MSELGAAQTTVPVRHRGGQYPVVVSEGALEGLGAALGAVVAPARVFLVTNPVVDALYGDAAAASLSRAGVSVTRLLIPDGEAHKHLETYAALVDTLLSAGVERGTPIVALGGGVTGDLVGFAGATVLRGVPVVQVPTTLLAMVDSAVGGKTGVNSLRGKNLIGAFHAPILVYAGLATLRSLPEAELRSGLGEVVKHAMICDDGLFERLEAAAGAPWSEALLADMVVQSCRIKARIVSADEQEAGDRALLNYGHTVGHAIEAALGFGELRHGECVAIGIIAESRWAAERGHAPAAIALRATALIDALGFPTPPPRLSPSRLLEAVGYDKKLTRGTLATAIVNPLGSATLRRVGSAEVEVMLRCIPGSSEE